MSSTPSQSLTRLHCWVHLFLLLLPSHIHPLTFLHTSTLEFLYLFIFYTCLLHPLSLSHVFTVEIFLFFFFFFYSHMHSLILLYIFTPQFFFYYLLSSFFLILSSISLHSLTRFHSPPYYYCSFSHWHLYILNSLTDTHPSALLLLLPIQSPFKSPFTSSSLSSSSSPSSCSIFIFLFPHIFLALIPSLCIYSLASFMSSSQSQTALHHVL